MLDLESNREPYEWQPWPIDLLAQTAQFDWDSLESPHLLLGGRYSYTKMARRPWVKHPGRIYAYSQALARLFGLFFRYPWFSGILASTMSVRLDDVKVIDAVVCMVGGPRIRAQSK